MTPTTQPGTLTRSQIRKVLKRHRLSIVRLAEQLGVRPQSISCWLKGRTNSERIAVAANARAIELLSLEEKNHAA